MKSRYKVDLKGLQAVCGMNYAKLLRLMPGRETRDSWDYSASPNGVHTITIRILDRAPYTTTIAVEQQGNISKWLRDLSLGVRIYHDAEMAEVVNWAQYRQFLGRYPYPNKDMHQMDEKAQLNQFLSDWLSLCIAQGHSLEYPNFTKLGEGI
ncbi:DUF1249 domain-containing protein [Pseudoteredinibacter isoporae]|uniref:DUF1249 domain-containing protein n=1 Tax=Pseudoteredinibacter isoporae TaxID=570281 RepID=UPI0031025F9A